MVTIETEVEHGPALSEEEEAVFLWRVERLRDAGYSLEAACNLVSSRDVDLHLAVDLISRGCPHSTAVRIVV